MSNDIRKIEYFGERIALINGANQQKVTYAELAELVFDCQKKLPKDAKQLLLAEVSNCVESIVIYLSALSSGIPIILISKENELAFQNIDSIFKPTLGYRFINGG